MLLAEVVCKIAGVISSIYVDLFEIVRRFARPDVNSDFKATKLRPHLEFIRRWLILRLCTGPLLALLFSKWLRTLNRILLTDERRDRYHRLISLIMLFRR